MKKILKRTISILLAVVITFGAAPFADVVGIDLPEFDNLFATKAEAATYSGKCGDNLTWTLDSKTGELVIGGTGDMYDYSSESRTIWNNEYDEIIKTVTIGNKVKSVGDFALFDLPKLKNVTIGNGVTKIGEWSFSHCENLESITIPDSVTSIGDQAFRACLGLKNIKIGKNVKSIGDLAFCECESLENIAIPDSVITGIGEFAFADLDCLTSVVIGNGVPSIETSAFFDCNSLKTVTIGRGVTNIDGTAFGQCNNLTDIYYTGTETQWKAITILGEEYIPSVTIHYNYAQQNNEYNLGEETYSFKNFGDSDSELGHCFGMAVTSSSYYLNLLDVSPLGVESSEINSLKNTDKVKKPICHYQKIQGTYKVNAHVSSYEWSDAVSYVKNHAFDNTGSLIVDTFYFDNSENMMRGHAVNFLYYKNVNGQDRIYVYDNNFPNIETYYYQDSNGKILQAPKSTFIHYIEQIYLIDIYAYMKNAENFAPERVIYSEGKSLSIDGVEGSPMTSASGEETKYMFEIPEGVEQITITPLVNNAEFEYLGKTYSFGNIKEDTVGVFTLAESDDASGDFVIENPGESESLWDAFIYFLKALFDLIFLPITIWFA